MQRVAATLLLLLVAPAATGEPRRSARDILAQLPPAAQRELHERGSVLLPAERSRDDGAAGPVEAYVIFAQPLSRTFELLSQTGRQAEFRPEVQSIRPIERAADGSLDEHHLRLLFVQVVYRLRYRFEPHAARITWSLDPLFANDLRRVEGFWQLHPLDDGRTLGRFGTRVDVGPLLPSFLQDRVTRKNLPSTIEHCRRWVDAGARR